MHLLTDKRQELENEVKDFFASQAMKWHQMDANKAEEVGLPIPAEASHYIRTESGGNFKVSTVHRDGVYLLVDGGDTGSVIFYEWSELMEYQIFAVLEMVESIQHYLFPPATV